MQGQEGPSVKGLHELIRNTIANPAFIEDDLSFVAPQLYPSKGEAFWYRVGATITTGVVVSAIWFLKIAPDEKTPNTLMVQPAAEALESFIQPTTSMADLSHDVGFNVRVPDLKHLGVQLAAVGESEFGGQRAAVMQYQHAGSVFLFYSVNQTSKLLSEMKQVDAAGHPFYVASGGAVSVVAWKDRSSGYHAIAAKTTEQELLALAAKVDRGS